MKYCSVAETAQRWGISERSVRNYCAQGRVPGAEKRGRSWVIPDDAVMPERLNKRQELPENLPERLLYEMEHGVRGGIYHFTQIALTYNSNHIEGSRLTEDQTRLIFETNTLGHDATGVPVDDIVETANHFQCFDYMLQYYNRPLSERFIKELHRTLKNGTSDARADWFAVGDYKKVPNMVGGRETALPGDVPKAMRTLLNDYRNIASPSLDDLVEFHVRFERIHPFQDGNGRVGRLLLFKECLRWGIPPFIIDDRHKGFYYNGLQEWDRLSGYLRDTCLLMQDDYKARLDYFGIEY